MRERHRWNTREYEERTRQLYRTELHKLYPSEAWALYRILPQCDSILDLGCGNGAMAAVARQIAPDARYTGVDHQARLMEEAAEAFPYAGFHAADLAEYLKTAPEFDCVMSWSVIKSFADWRGLVAGMVDRARKFVVCDIRVANTEIEAFDDQVCSADYGGRRGPIVFLGYPGYRDALLEHKDQLDRIEIAAYQSEWGKFVHLREDLRPETFLVISVLTGKGVLDGNEFELFERLPGNLKR